MRGSSELDAIIVGAGPAGATTALLLARAGHTVTLLDRQRFPRAKPCGDCLSAEAARVLDRLGVLAAVEAQNPARLSGWRIVSPDGESFFGAFAAADSRIATALSLPRERLDHVLAEGARHHGATVRHGIHVTGVIQANDGRVVGIRGSEAAGAPVELRARLVVGADGLRSIVARRLGMLRRAPRLRKVSLTAHVTGVADIQSIGEMHIADRACAGLAPVSAAACAAAPLCNLTLVVDAARFARDLAGDTEAFFWTMLHRFPRLTRRLDAASMVPRNGAPAPRLLACGPFDWPTRAVTADGAALVGDAAGYYDPFTGQGIYQALAGAEILAEEADGALRAGDTSRRGLRRYAVRHARLVRGARVLQRSIEFVTARPALVNAAVQRLARAPRAAAALIATAADLRPVASLAAPDVLTDFLLASSRPETTA